LNHFVTIFKTSVTKLIPGKSRYRGLSHGTRKTLFFLLKYALTSSLAHISSYSLRTGISTQRSTHLH